MTKKIIAFSVLILLLGGCTNTQTIATPTSQSDVYVFEDVLLKGVFDDTYEFSCPSTEPLHSSMFEDETFLINNDLFRNENVWDDDFYLDDYDLSWIDDIAENGFVDPNIVLNHINDDTILYQTSLSVFGEGDDGMVYIDENSDLHLPLDQEYDSDQYSPIGTGIRYKDSYLKDVLAGEIKPVSNDTRLYPHYNFGRYYNVAIGERKGEDYYNSAVGDDNNIDIEIELFAVDDGTNIEISLTVDNEYYTAKAFSDVDIIELADLKGEVETVYVNSTPILASDSDLRKAFADESLEFSDPMAYVHEDVLVKDIYGEDAYIQYSKFTDNYYFPFKDRRITTLEDKTFLLDAAILGNTFKYFSYNEPHNSHLADDMYLDDYDETWLDEAVASMPSDLQFSEIATFDTDIDFDDVLNGFDDNTILFESCVYIYELVDGEKIIIETPYTSNYYGYQGYIQMGIRYKDSYLLKVARGNVTKYNEPIDYNSATVSRSYEVAIDETHSLDIDLIDHEGGTLIITDMDGGQRVNFYSDVDLKTLMNE